MGSIQYMLEVQSGPQQGRVYPLGEGDFVLGRGPRCAIVLSDNQIAPTHCGLRIRHDQVIIAPGGTVTETLVNGERLDKARLLRVADTIALGSYVLVLRAKSTGDETRFFPGEQVGEFQLLRELGVGAVGRVYEAVNAAGARVALKVLRQRAEWSMRETEHRRALFRREASALGAITHPNVVRFFGAGELDGLPWLAMEVLQGVNLREKMATGRLPLRDIEKIMFQLCAAVAACHAVGVIHRDLKPANVMVVGADERVVLTDFGLAQPHAAPRLDELDPTQEGHLIRVGRQVGTPAYMAPEQTLGSEADLRSDVWSLGAMLYELCAGRRPFPGQDVRAVLHAVVRQCPAELPEDLPAHLRSAVYRCLQKKPDRRFPNAVAMVEAVHDKRVVQWLPVGAEGPAPTELEGCPLCGLPLEHALRCLRCGGSIFRYTDGQVLTIAQPGKRPGLACGACGGAVTAEMTRCPTCGREYSDTPAEGVAKTPALLTVGRAKVVDQYEQALGLLANCPCCNSRREDGRQSTCDKCGFVLRAYVTSRVRLELATGGWELRCCHCSTLVPDVAEKHCPGCGLNFLNGLFPDGVRHEDELPPVLRRKLEKGH